MKLSGTCTVFVAFDVGRAIDLAGAERRLKAPAPSPLEWIIIVLIAVEIVFFFL